ncbi:MAG: enoyl-CoA hydratase/isomerase family protein [Acidimicrobiales bacterium]|nr:enoyl-CoA hydratase/isomerase family protein [Acidimicrobiales bacterium]
MELQTMEYEVDGNVAHVNFARPEAANAVNPIFCRELKSVMSEVEADDSVQAVSVTAEGKVFCAGGDLKEFNAAGEGLPGVVEAMLEDLHDAIYMMNAIPKPFVAGVQGAAGGAGMSLVSAFDLVVSGESAKFTMAYTKVGLTPDGTSSYFLSRHIGLRRMLDLTLTNRVLSAVEAEAWGLVNRVVPDEDIAEATIALAQQLANGAPNAAGTAKTVIYQGYESSLEEAGDFEAENIVRAAGTNDGQEGIAAFVERRDPDWTGT